MMESKPLVLALGAVIVLGSLLAAVVNGENLPRCGARVLARESRRLVAATESGAVTAVDVDDSYGGKYHVQFMSLEPASLLLPVLLNADMAFYVKTGRGTITYMSAINQEEDDDDVRPKEIEVMRGDVYRLEQGTVFYVRSHPDSNRERLQIHAIFNTEETRSPMESLVSAYSNINELVRGFDGGVLQMGFGVSEEIIQEITSAPVPPSIVPVPERSETEANLSWKEGVFEALIGVRGPMSELTGNKKKKKKKKEKEKSMRKGLFNFFDHKPDVENCNGWSTAVTHKDLKVLRGSSFGVFMVNLTRGAMMGPHWNPKATEIAVVIHGQGMVQVVCPSKNPSGSLPPAGKGGASSECRQRKFRVREGDLFVVPRYYAMAQVAYNNDTFVYVGFSTASGNNRPQYLAGKRSVLRTVNRDVLAASLGAPNSTAVDKLLASEGESIILACTSCAEDLERKMEEEGQSQGQEEGGAEEERGRGEEEARRRQEEEARRREEEEARRREEEEEEEEEARRREEEEARRKQEGGEEEARREEEEARRRQEEEEARRREATGPKEEAGAQQGEEGGEGEPGETMARSTKHEEPRLL